MAFKSDPGQCSCGNIFNRLEKRGTCPCLIQIQQDILGTDGSAKLCCFAWKVQSHTLSAPLTVTQSQLS